MLAFTASLLAIIGATSVVARPSPKIPGVRWPKYTKYGQHLSTRGEEILNLTSESVHSAPTAVSPYENIFASLTNDEAAGVIAFLHNSTLNLTANADAGEWDNTITTVDFLPPNKTDAVSYLDSQGKKPARWAKATISFAATEEPYLQDYMIGPLPISNETIYTELAYTSTSGGRVRNFDADHSKVDIWEYAIAESVADIILDLLDGTITGSENDTLEAWGIDPLWRETDDNGKEIIVDWVQFWRIPEYFSAGTLLPQGLYYKTERSTRNPDDWKLLGWLYNDVYYTSTAEFRAAWESPDFEKMDINYESSTVTGTDRDTTHEFAEDEKIAPLSVQPDGQRFSVDDDSKYVEWMDFSFFVTFTRDTGMRLYDVKYKGERIMYELGLQEALATYAGNDPLQSGTAYLDTFYGFGPYAFELIEGYDCPTYSHFLNTTFHQSEISKTHRRGMCLFEADANYLIQRHSSDDYVSATKNIVLTLRSVSTVGNYDYNFDYIFALDGSIEVVVRASGYIQSAYYAKNDDYGYKISEALSGSMHDHILTFKVDLDIAGRNNTLVQHSLVAADVKYPWSNTSRSTMKLERSRIENEDEGKLNWPDHTMVMVVNEDEPNKYGEARGYRIMPSRGGGMKMTIQDSPNLLESCGFASHNLYVTRQHDSEQCASHAGNAYDPGNPVVDFNKFFNSENLVQKDIVVWANLGMNHVPHTGDLPNTVFTTAQSGFVLAPHNYLLSDPSRASRQQVRISYSGETGVTEVKGFGGRQPEGLLNLTTMAPNLWDYSGDVAVRKFPYDPLHPYNDTESI